MDSEETLRILMAAAILRCNGRSAQRAAIEAVKLNAQVRRLLVEGIPEEEPDVRF
jgi:hypothetical protein